MKCLGMLIAVIFFLNGCSGEPEEIRTGMELRNKLLQSEKCSFRAEITADYGDQLHSFTMDCSCDNNGDLSFTVISPDSISGISGRITDEGGALTFDDTALSFPLLTDDQLSPISAPWILMKTLRSGYLTSACREEGMIRLSIDDSYEENALSLDIWLDGTQLPARGEILYDGRRILTLNVTSFVIS